MIDYKMLYIFNEYNLVSLETTMHPWNHYTIYAMNMFILSKSFPLLFNYYYYYFCFMIRALNI